MLESYPFLSLEILIIVYLQKSINYLTINSINFFLSNYFLNYLYVYLIF